MKQVLDRFFHPRSIAVVGATEKAGKIGSTVLENLLQGGYQGKLYAVNPKYRTVHGVRCYARLRRLPASPDLVVFALPAAYVPDLMEDCAAIGATCALVLSGGFQADGPEADQRLLRALKEAAARHGVRLIGPDSLGLMTPSIGLNATYAPAMPGAGRLAFISQSGALGAAVLDWAAEKRVGISHFVSVGQMADIGIDVLIDYFGADSRTACILMYVETLSQARRFMSAARAFARSKPIVVLKAGASASGARATLLHAGAMAGNDAVFEAAFRRAGVIRVQTVQELFDCAQALALQPLPAGNRLAIITNAGGPAILATDVLEKYGGTLASLAPTFVETLSEALPPDWSRSNPLDLSGLASAEHYRAALRTCLQDSDTDAVLVILTPQRPADAEAVAHVVVEESRNTSGKPIFAAWMGQRFVQAGRQVLENSGIPWYPFPERAVAAFLHAAHYRRNLEMLYETPPDLPIDMPGISRSAAQGIIEAVRASGRVHLEESEARRLLACYGIPVNTAYLARNEDEVAAIMRNLGGPVALKIESPDIWHKSEVHGVRLGIETEFGARQVFRFLMENVRKKRPDARLVGVTVERMVNVQHELLIGSFKDPIFGPVIVFGLGGVATEIWRDRAIGLPPLNLALARHLVEGTRIAQLLRGFRHLPPAPVEQLYDLLVRFAYLLMDFPDLAEVEINPFALGPDGGVALDAAASLEPTPSAQREPYEHLCIQPYPTQWIKKVEHAKSGHTILLRPIRPEDEPLEAELVQNASRESLYYRFFGFTPGIDHKMLARFTHIDYDREMAIVAVVEEGGKPHIIGVVRIVGDAWREECEYAILVADAWHGKGIGSLLTDYIIEIARAQGYRRITATFLKTNTAMRRVFERKGFTIRPGDGADYAELALQ